MCRVVITDSGPGIPPEIRPRLFTPFVTTKARGTGLGLSTVKSICAAHGAEVEVLSTPGAGSTFRVRQPLAADSVAGS